MTTASGAASGNSVTEAAAPEAQQQHGKRVAFLAQLVEPLEHLHLTAVDEAGTAGRHPGAPDELRDLGAALDRGENLASSLSISWRRTSISASLVGTAVSFAAEATV